MKVIKVKAVFPQPNSFGFYGNKRRYNNDEFDFQYDDSRPLEDQIYDWMEALEKPKGKPGPKPKADPVEPLQS